jgi:hypothetical protein
MIPNKELIQILFHSQRSNIITKVNDNINMDSTIHFVPVSSHHILCLSQATTFCACLKPPHFVPVSNQDLDFLRHISWWSVLLVEENRGPGENHRHVASHSQTLSYNAIHLALIEIQTHNISGVDGSPYQKTFKERHKIIQT